MRLMNVESKADAEERSVPISAPIFPRPLSCTSTSHIDLADERACIALSPSVIAGIKVSRNCRPGFWPSPSLELRHHLWAHASELYIIARHLLIERYLHDVFWSLSASSREGAHGDQI